MHNSRKLQFEQATLMDCAASGTTLDPAFAAALASGQETGGGGWSNIERAKDRLSVSLPTFTVLDANQVN
jgi:hypothetical protein